MQNENIAILGSTGSIGTQTIEVIEAHPERFKLVALAAGNNAERIIDQARRHRPRVVSVGTAQVADRVRDHLPPGTELYTGAEGLLRVATLDTVHTVVTAVVGSVGLKPTLAAIEAGKKIALANKETLVTAGELVMTQAKRHRATILPVDSEHSAIFQCLQGQKEKQVEQIILTASGGSFRHKSREELANVSVQEALQHPNWSMGAKITIDSATMMNKGFEVIETRWLFDMSFEHIRVILHQESIIHSMVAFQDTTVLAQLGTPDMRVPIQYALTYPERIFVPGERLDLAKLGKLHFREMDFDRFPCLKMAFDAGKRGGTYPTVLNAANEVAVQRFLQKEISFLGIEAVIEETLAKHDNVPSPTLEDIEATDRWARQEAYAIKGR
jgi:1-deoxy-D-xylulose-5-phosphate reductoisomerase